MSSIFEDVLLKAHYIMCIVRDTDSLVECHEIAQISHKCHCWYVYHQCVRDTNKYFIYNLSMRISGVWCAPLCDVTLYDNHREEISERCKMCDIWWNPYINIIIIMKRKTCFVRSWMLQCTCLEKHLIVRFVYFTRTPIIACLQPI